MVMIILRRNHWEVVMVQDGVDQMGEGDPCKLFIFILIRLRRAPADSSCKFQGTIHAAGLDVETNPSVR